jgi:hypothetical protein
VDPVELDAVIAHEHAHLSHGHARIAGLGSALAAAAWNSPPARRSLRSIRESLELLADTEALKALPYPAPLSSAMAKLSERGSSHPMSFADGAFLDRRLGCLTAPPPMSSPTSWAVDVIAAVVGAGFAVTVCGALHLRFAVVGVAVCVAAAAALWQVLRPLHSPTDDTGILRLRPPTSRSEQSPSRPKDA